MNLKEIKELHKIFIGLNSCKEFYDYIKALSKENKISIIEKENKMLISFIVDYLLKKIVLKLFYSKKSKALNQL